VVRLDVLVQERRLAIAEDDVCVADHIGDERERLRRIGPIDEHVADRMHDDLALAHLVIDHGRILLFAPRMLRRLGPTKHRRTPS
jgi:hypothetical protein